MQSLDFVGKTPFVAGIIHIYTNLKYIFSFVCDSGWGHRVENTRMSNILQQVQVPVVGNDECKQKYEDADRFQLGAEYRFNETYVICAGWITGGKDACQGDSGGPLMLPINENRKFSFYQIGIVSYGHRCGQPNIPGVYAAVQKYVDWIIEKLN